MNDDKDNRFANNPDYIINYLPPFLWYVRPTNEIERLWIERQKEAYGRWEQFVGWRLRDYSCFVNNLQFVGGFELLGMNVVYLYVSRFKIKILEIEKRETSKKIYLNNDYELSKIGFPFPYCGKVRGIMSETIY